MADQQLIQSGRNLYAAQSEQVDYGGAFQEGADLIQNQIDDNLKRKQAAEDREYELDKRRQESQLREIGLEQKIMAYNEDKNATFGLLEQAFETGALKKADYPGYEQMGKDWLKDQANQFKLLEDSGGKEALKSRVNGVVNGRNNWQNVVGFSQSSSISADSPNAQKIDYAIEAWARNSDNPPPTQTIDGQDYFVLPSADGTEEVKIPVDKLGKAGQLSDITGEYAEMKDFSTTMADWSASNPGVYKRLSAGTATQTDIAGIGNWFASNVKSDVQKQELADSFFISSGITPGSEIAQQLGVSDVNNDGQITSQDIDVADFQEIFTGAILQMGGFPQEQIGDQVTKAARDKVLGRGQGGGGNTDVTPQYRLGQAISTGDYSQIQGLPIKTGVKGEYVQNVITPGSNYKDKGKNIEATEYLVQTSKGNVIKLGQDPQAGLSNALGIKITTGDIKAQQNAQKVQNRASEILANSTKHTQHCLLYTSPSPRDS